MEAEKDYVFVVFFIIDANLYVCQINADARSRQLWKNSRLSHGSSPFRG